MIAGKYLTFALSLATVVAAGYGSHAEGMNKPSPASIPPNPEYNMTDCNGWSSTYKPVRPAMRMDCVDPTNVFARSGEYGGGRFLDNGHYVGHDEPAVRYLSSAPGSGNTMTYFMQLPTDPPGAPTTTRTGTTTTDTVELAPASWFGIATCDSKSFPTEGGTAPRSAPCTPVDDGNAPGGANGFGGGSAVMELQFYAPGYGPFLDAPSCDQHRYCAALNIDSAEVVCNPGCSANPRCAEPANFAFLTLDGVPTGPPSPQLANVESFSPNADTLFMSQGDSLRVRIFDTPNGIETRVDDLTTGQSGLMIASAANGFMNTDANTCNGSPYTFRAEYDTAKQANVNPWGSLEVGVASALETGHFEPCSSLTNQSGVNLTYGNGDTFSDPSIYQTCNGAFEGIGTTEGPCSSSCSNGRTEGDISCSISSGQPCELSDTPCAPSGGRNVTQNGSQQTWTWPVGGCVDSFAQNGDLDFDGSAYLADWPDGAATHPTSFRYLGPFGPDGNEYPQTQFETDAPASEATCNTSTGMLCSVPPAAPATFYPYWSITRTQGLAGVTPTVANACVWNFGSDITGVTGNDFSKDSQYGSPDLGRYPGNVFGGTLISAPASNPTTVNSTINCPTLTRTQVIPPPAPSPGFSGDHRGDLAALNDTSVWLARSTGANSFASPALGSSGAFYGSVATLEGDVNGDGRVDLVAVNQSSTWVETASPTGGFNPPVQWSSTPFYGSRATLLADLSGDGRADLIAVNDIGVWVMYANSSGTGFLGPQAVSSDRFYGNVATLAADVDGDGKSDLVAVNTDGAFAELSSGSVLSTPIAWSSGAFYGNVATLAADVTGDGMSDLVAINGTSTWVMTSTGAAFNHPTQWSSGAFYGNRATLAADVNGDGKSDLVALNDSSTWVMTASGTAFSPPALWSSFLFYGSRETVAGN